MIKGLKTKAVKFAVFTVVSLVLFTLIFNTMQDRVDGDLESYHATFRDVSGLRVGDNMRVSGVKVGKVTAIEVQGRQARVDFTLRKSQPLLDTTRLVMRYQNLLGQRYVSLVQGPERGAVMNPGSTVPVDRTDPGFDLTGLLNGFRPLFDVLKPADVNQLATTIVRVFQGEGGTVGQLLQQTASVTSFLADRDEIFDQVVQRLTPVLDNLDRQNDDIDDTVAALNELMKGLADERDTIGSSISKMSTLITETSDFLVEAREPSANLVKSLRLTTQMFADNLESVEAAVIGFPVIISALGRVTSYQNAGNVYICQFVLKYGSVRVNVAPDGPYSEVCGG